MNEEIRDVQKQSSNKKFDFKYLKMKLQQIDWKKVNFQEIKKFLKEFFANKQKVFYFIVWIIALQVLFMLIYWLRIFLNYRELDAKSSSLNLITNSKSLWLDQNILAINDINNISDLLNIYQGIYDEKIKMDDYFQKLQTPYDNFLKYIYLPPLDIWKDPYWTWMDTTLVWQKFLQNNPYIDTNLLSKWSDFFRSAWDNVPYNEIVDIQIWNIDEEVDGWEYFELPINVTFIAPERRAFLMLVDKLSMTSNKRNISLINEFFYNIWTVIKSNKEQVIDTYIATIRKERDDKEKHIIELRKDLDNNNLPAEIVKQRQDLIEQDQDRMNYIDKELSLYEGNIDQYIWFKFYEWIFNDKSNNILNDTIIQKAIVLSANCNDNTSKDVCFYNFRDKYRNLPSLAYTIWVDRWDKVEQLKVFLKNMPPLFNIRSFTFRKNETASLTQADDQYYGEVYITLFGRAIKDEEYIDIQKILWNMCFDEGGLMSIENAVSKINDKISLLSQQKSIDSTENRDLLELKDIISQWEKEFRKQTNYQKIIRLFEIYRMLEDNNICKI